MAPGLHRSVPAIRGEWSPAGGTDRSSSRCLRACCWTPLGHSTVRDNLPDKHPDACRCHPKEKS